MGHSVTQSVRLLLSRPSSHWTSRSDGLISQSAR